MAYQSISRTQVSTISNQATAMQAPSLHEAMPTLTVCMTKLLWKILPNSLAIRMNSNKAEVYVVNPTPLKFNVQLGRKLVKDYLGNLPSICTGSA